jgi:hypothetical protein
MKKCAIDLNKEFEAIEKELMPKRHMNTERRVLEQLQVPLIGQKKYGPSETNSI